MQRASALQKVVCCVSCCACAGLLLLDDRILKWFRRTKNYYNQNLKFHTQRVCSAQEMSSEENVRCVMTVSEHTLS